MRNAWPVGVAALILIMLANRTAETGSPGTPSGGTPAARIGIVDAAVDAVPIPDAVQDNDTDPGERPLLTRWSEVAPPMIPHGIRDFLPLTRSENACQDCHAVEAKVEGEPTPIPPSHYRDLRRAPDTLREGIAGSRYVCTSCHAPQTDATPLDLRAP